MLLMMSFGLTPKAQQPDDFKNGEFIRRPCEVDMNSRK
jgi:hypothetical protein